MKNTTKSLVKNSIKKKFMKKKKNCSQNFFKMDG